MADRIKMNFGEISSAASNMSSKISDYKDTVAQLQTLINEINSSGAWKDAQVKTSFINTCNDYITLYKYFANVMTEYVKYLNAKAACAEGLEKNFSR